MPGYDVLGTIPPTIHIIASSNTIINVTRGTSSSHFSWKKIPQTIGGERTLQSGRPQDEEGHQSNETKRKNKKPWEKGKETLGK